MSTNFDKGLEEIGKVANNWVYKHLNIFGKITAAKFNKIGHTAPLLPTPSKTVCDSFNHKIYKYIKENNQDGNTKSSIVSEEVLYAHKNKLDLGLHKIKQYWKASKMPWLQRLERDSLLKKLHFEDLNILPLTPLSRQSNHIKLLVRTCLTLH